MQTKERSQEGWAMRKIRALAISLTALVPFLAYGQDQAQICSELSRSCRAQCTTQECREDCAGKGLRCLMPDYKNSFNPSLDAQDQTQICLDLANVCRVRCPTYQCAEECATKGLRCINPNHVSAPRDPAGSSAGRSSASPDPAGSSARTSPAPPPFAEPSTSRSSSRATLSAPSTPSSASGIANQSEGNCAGSVQRIAQCRSLSGSCEGTIAADKCLVKVREDYANNRANCYSIYPPVNRAQYEIQMEANRVCKNRQLR